MWCVAWIGHDLWFMLSTLMTDVSSSQSAHADLGTTQRRESFDCMQTVVPNSGRILREALYSYGLGHLIHADQRSKFADPKGFGTGFARKQCNTTA